MSQYTLPPDTPKQEEWKSPFDDFKTIGEKRNDRPQHTPLKNYFWFVLATTLAGGILAAGLFTYGLTQMGPTSPDDYMMDYDNLISVFKIVILIGMGLGFLTGLGCCLHWNVMKARDRKAQRERSKARNRANH